MRIEENGKMITDWLEKNGNPAIEKQVEKELENMFKNKIFNENCLNTMKRMPDNFIDLTVTSPPYDNLRDYKGYCFDFENVAKELFRVTKQGGVVVWVVNDSKVKGSKTLTSFKQALYFKEIGFNVHDVMFWKKSTFNAPKPNVYHNVIEYIFVLSKGNPKTFNPIIDRKNIHSGRCVNPTIRYSDGRTEKRSTKTINEFGKRFNLWEISEVKNNKEKSHPAPFPEALANDLIISWSNENDLVYDCFAGSGTTAKMSILNKRNYIGSEISKEYCDIIEQRLNQTKAQLTMF